MGRLSERVGLILGLIVVGVGGALASSIPPPVPERKPAVTLPESGTLVFEKTEVDFGEISDEGPIEMQLPFTNTGTQAITIRRMHSHCGCTTPELDKKIYQAGESGSITVVFDPNRRYGRQAKKVTVYTDDPILPIKNLMIRGYVRAISYVEPFLTNFGEADKDETSSKVLYVLGEMEGFEITEVLSSKPELVVGEVVGSAPVSKDGLKMVRYTIRADLLGGKTSGRYIEQLTMKTNDPRRPEIQANVMVRVPSELKLGWAMVRVGKLAVGDLIEEEIVLGHVGKAPFKIESITSESRMLDLEFEWTEPEDPELPHKIVMKGSAIKGGGSILDKVIITTDLADEEPMTVAFRGLVAAPAKTAVESSTPEPEAQGVVEIDD